MPKKKKKEKGGGDDDGSGDPLATSMSVPGGLSMSNSTSMLSKTSLTSTLNASKSTFGMTKDSDQNNGGPGQSEISEMEKALEAHQKDESPGMGGGMGVFAINKDGISRAVVKFIEKPKPQPLTISFHFPGTFLTHKYVMAIIRQHIQNIPDSSVTHVQYMDRNVRLGTRGLENRWLVTVTPLRAKEQLIRLGIKIVNRTIYAKSYDDVCNEEYREYQRYSDLQNKLKMGFGSKNKKPAAGVTTPAAANTKENTTAGETREIEKIEEEPESEEDGEDDNDEEDGEEEN